MEDIYPEELKPGDLVQGYSTEPWDALGLVVAIGMPTELSVRASVMYDLNIHPMYFRKNMPVRAYRSST